MIKRSYFYHATGAKGSDMIHPNLSAYGWFEVRSWLSKPRVAYFAAKEDAARALGIKESEVILKCLTRI